MKPKKMSYNSRSKSGKKLKAINLMLHIYGSNSLLLANNAVRIYGHQCRVPYKCLKNLLLTTI